MIDELIGLRMAPSIIGGSSLRSNRSVLASVTVTAGPRAEGASAASGCVL